MKNLYFYVEDLSLDSKDKNTIVDYIKSLGKKDADKNPKNPKNINHWRVSLDGKKAIFEAWWDESELVNSITSKLTATIDKSVPVENVSKITKQGTEIIYTDKSVNKFKMLVFGGMSSSYEESQKQCQIFLYKNISDWEVGKE
jgi:DNA primase catalytic subunit